MRSVLADTIHPSSSALTTNRSDMARSPTSRGIARMVILGAGKLGRAIAPALRERGETVVGPLGRGETIPALTEHDCILLCVPDDAIARVAAEIPVGPFVGHCAGALS